MILRRTQEPKSFFGNFEITGADLDWPIIYGRPILAVLWRTILRRAILVIARILAGWSKFLPAILMWPVVSTVLMMSCAHEMSEGSGPKLQPSNT